MLEALQLFRIIPITQTTQQPLDTSHNPTSEEVCIKIPPCGTEDIHGSYENWPGFRICIRQSIYNTQS